MLIALAACKGEAEPSRDPPRDRPSKPKPTEAAAETAQPAAAPEPTGPRYLRPGSGGTLVDAFQFPSVPASIVEQEVAEASTRSAAAGVLRRFGLNTLEGKTGEVWIAPASLVDRQARERLLVVAFRNDEGEEHSWLVFLGSRPTAEDERLLRIGSARVDGRAPIAIDARELHFSGADDVVATWKTCTGSSKCHSLRAWTMQHGYPEQIADVTGDAPPIIAGGLTPPYDIVVDGRVLRFDEKAFAYR